MGRHYAESGFDGTNNQAGLILSPIGSFKRKKFLIHKPPCKALLHGPKLHPNRVQEMLNANPRFIFLSIL
jgi:hypothetical protein